MFVVALIHPCYLLCNISADSFMFYYTSYFLYLFHVIIILFSCFDSACLQPLRRSSAHNAELRITIKAFWFLMKLHGDEDEKITAELFNDFLFFFLKESQKLADIWRENKRSPTRCLVSPKWPCVRVKHNEKIWLERALKTSCSAEKWLLGFRS